MKDKGFLLLILLLFSLLFLGLGPVVAAGVPGAGVVAETGRPGGDGLPVEDGCGANGIAPGQPVTVTARVTIIDDPAATEEIFLAGLASSLDGTLLVGLRWAPAESGVPSPGGAVQGRHWQLQLITATGLLDFDYLDRTILDHGQYVDLVVLDEAVFFPEKNRSYTACLSYHPGDGRVAVALMDRSRADLVYAATVRIEPPGGKVYPLAGGRGGKAYGAGKEGKGLRLEAVAVTEEFKSYGLPLLKHQTEMELTTDEGEPVRETFDRERKLIISFSWPDLPESAAVRLRFFNAKHDLSFPVAGSPARPARLEIEGARLPAGHYQVALEVINDGTYQLLKSTFLQVGNNQVRLEFQLYGRNYRQDPERIDQPLPADPGLTGRVRVESAKRVAAFPLVLEARYYPLTGEMLLPNGEVDLARPPAGAPEQVIPVCHTELELSAGEALTLEFSCPLPPGAGLVELAATGPDDTQVILVNNRTRVWPAPLVTAFPGAEGFGAYAVGGRGGKVYTVTTLADQGPGSLREALEATGPRTVVFAVSGTIRLASPIRVTNPYLTVAGQTAPGDGICLAGHTLIIETHDVILRYLRFRPGDLAGVETDALSVRGGYHVMIDHCSLSWSVDSLLDLTVGSGLNTVQWCILSEALNQSWHSKGAHGYAAGWDGSGAGGSSYHHNLLATCNSRMPRIDKYARVPRVLVDVRNNVIYNWGSNSAYGGEFADMNWVNNYYKPGPATAAGVRSRLFESDSEMNKMYLSGNYLEGSPRVTADNWRGVNFRSGSMKTLRVDTPFKVAPVQTEPVETAYRRVLAEAGAVLPKRDPVDERIVRDVQAGTGRLIDSQDEVGGWPELRTYNVPVDTDRDGMPDWWEEANGLDPTDPEDRNRVDSTGYTCLEVYLHSLTQGVF